MKEQLMEMLGKVQAMYEREETTDEDMEMLYKTGEQLSLLFTAEIGKQQAQTLFSVIRDIALNEVLSNLKLRSYYGQGRAN